MVGKKIKGRKRHIVVDILGCILAVVVHAANLHDTKSGIMAVEEAMSIYPSIRGFCADAGYRGTFEEQVWDKYKLGVDISERIKPKEWKILPKRWIVERTFAWMNNSRRLSKDYEITIQSSETMIKLSHIHTLLKRL